MPSPELGHQRKPRLAQKTRLYRNDSIADIMVMRIATSRPCFVLIPALILTALTVDGCKDKKSTEPTPVLPGISWTFRSTGGLYDLRDIATNGTVLVAVGDSGRIITSSDGGAVWTLRTSGTSSDLSGVAFSPTQGFVAVSSSGSGSTVLLSSDGISWSSPTTSGITVGLNDVSANSNIIVGVGCGGNIFTSTSGVVWTPRVNSGPCVQAVERVGFSSVEFVSVGDSGIINSSSNGVGWPLSPSGVLNHFYGIAGGCSKAVAVGSNGIIKSSANGSTWVTVTTTGITLNAAACGGDNFVAVGIGGAVYTSHDAAATWVSRTSATTKELTGITRIGETFVAVGLDGTVVTSP